MTTPEYFPVDVRVFNLSDAPGSGGNGSFQIEISTTAPDEFNKVQVSASVSFGELVGETAGDIYGAMALIFGWFGPAVPGTPVPGGSTTELLVEWTCADGETGSDSFNLFDMVSAEIEVQDPPAQLEEGAVEEQVAEQEEAAL